MKFLLSADDDSFRIEPEEITAPDIDAAAELAENYIGPIRYRSSLSRDGVAGLLLETGRLQGYNLFPTA